MRLLAVRIIAVLVAAASCWTLPAAAATVQSLSPQGSVRDIRQVTARFSADMVALGDPRLADPFTVDCGEGAGVAGRGRWADTRNWVYDFEADLPGGLRCTLRLMPALRTLAGEAITGTNRFSFDTGGPAIRNSYPDEGGEIDSAQAFILALDAPATAASVVAHAACAVENLAERIPVQLVTGSEREQLLAQRRKLGHAYFRLLWKSGRESTERVSTAQLQQAERDLVVLRCARALPPATQVQLIWGRGIATGSGLLTAQDQSLSFQTRPEFTVRMECERVNPQAGCLPMRPMCVVFSAPVPRDKARVTVVDRLGTRYSPEQEPASAKSPGVEQLMFRGPFPEGTALTITLDPGLVDDAGRNPANAARFPLQVPFDDFPPLVKFAGEFGILESHAGGVLPVTLRNVEPVLMARRLTTPEAMGITGGSLRVNEDKQIAEWLRRVDTAMQPRGEYVQDKWRELTGSTSVFDVSEPLNVFAVPKIAGDKTFEVVGIPLKENGFYVVELSSPRLGAALLGPRQRRYVATSALVTNLAVHFKWGRESSLVWVTRLDSGRPVAGAQVRVSGFCTGAALWQGQTGSDGAVHVTTSLGEPHGSHYCNAWAAQPLMVSARSDADMSFTLSSWASGITPGDFSMPQGSERGSYVAHSVLDRALFRAGETVSMKHFLRQRLAQGLRVPQLAQRPTQMTVTHAGSGQRYEMPVGFDEAGIAESAWSIPRDARLGDYTVILHGDARAPRYSSGGFRVEQFRLPTMRAVVQPPKAALVDPTSVPLDLFVEYLSGGGASNASVKLRTQLAPRAVSFRNYDEFSFGGEDIKVGVADPDEGDDAFWLYSMRFGRYSDGEGAASQEQPAQVQALMLDDNGAARASVADLPRAAQARSLLAELEYQDANGERLTTATRIPLWPASLAVGVKVDGWAATKDKLRVQVVALDLNGKPLAAQRVTVEAFQRDSYSYRKRLIGGFYSYEYKTEVKRIAASCNGKTDSRGLLGCELAPGVAGQVLLRARAADAAGRVTLASTSAWVVGDDDWWFNPGNADRMDVLPERKEYQPGETARFQVRMPFRSATALVTVEREGVVDSFVTQLSGKNPTVEVPLRGNYAPNVFVSVLAVRGRVSPFKSWLAEKARKADLPWNFDGGYPTALVDLAKPTYKLGMARIRVGWNAHRLNVTAKPARDSYKVRETALVDVKVTRANGQPLPAGAEIALAVVDEALLELSANSSWALLDKMMGERGTEVWTSTAQMQVVGKRHYGRKAQPAGGGGGRAPARELFDTLLLWKGRVVLDAAGQARIEVPLNDSLSAFRVVAIASGADAFGTGEATLRTSQDLMLHAGLSPLVRETDRYAAIFTLRNASQRAMILDLAARYAGGALAAQSLQLAAGASGQVSWNALAPVGASALEWNVTAQERGGAARDALRVSQRVIAAYPVRTYQATIAQLEAPLTLQAAIPKGAVPGRGGIELALRPRLGAELSGVREYMSWYSYICTEQRLSTAVALRDRARWDTTLASLPALLDRDGLVRYFPAESLPGSDTLTAYILAIAHEADWTIPTGVRARMLDALKGFVAGRILRDSALPTADLAIRKLTAIEALARYQAADAAMLDSITIEPDLWPTSALLDWINILHSLPSIAHQKARLARADQLLRSRLNFQGTVMSFSTERRDALWWLMISGDVNATRAILTVLRNPQLRERWLPDMPRLVRGALSRQRRGHWNTTTANAWGVLAMEKFSAEFEATPVTGATRAQFGTQQFTAEGGSGTPTFAWPAASGQLSVAHSGAGKPWAIISSRAALPLQAPLFTGYTIKRSLAPVEQRVPGAWSAGDVVRVSLTVDAQSDMGWVVVDDPVPAGASILGNALGRDSAILSAGEQRVGYVYPAYEERRFDAFRSYYSFVPKGRFTLEYTLRLNNPGTFVLPATRVEAMYAPEMFGELPNAAVEVRSNP